MISPNWRTKIRELQLRDKIDLFLTCGIFPATAIYAAVAIYQCGANETELQAYVSFDSMNSPKRIVEVSKLPESYTLLNGYSIKPGAHLFILEAGGNLHNFGKTPAQQVRFGLKYVTRKYADPIGAVRCPLSKEVGLSAPLFISPDIGFPSGPVPLVIDKPTTDLIAAKQIALYLYGCISYQDVFSNLRCTKVCGIYDPDSGHFSFCPSNNQLDGCYTDYQAN